MFLLFDKIFLSIAESIQGSMRSFGDGRFKSKIALVAALLRNFRLKSAIDIDPCIFSASAWEDLVKKEKNKLASQFEARVT